MWPDGWFSITATNRCLEGYISKRGEIIEDIIPKRRLQSETNVPMVMRLPVSRVSFMPM